MISQTQPIISSAVAVPLQTIVDETTTNITLVGKSIPGTLTSERKWQIYQVDTTVSNVTEIFYPFDPYRNQPSGFFEMEWDERANYQYVDGTYDATPTAFTLTGNASIPSGSDFTSATVTVAGINVDMLAVITNADGGPLPNGISIKVNGTDTLQHQAVVSVTDTVSIFIHPSIMAPVTTVDITLTIGSVSSTATYTIV